MALFTAAELQAIAEALGQTGLGLSGREIGHLITSCRMVDPGETTKRRRLYNAFAESQNSRQNRTHILELIRMAMSPARYASEPGRYEPMRANLNRALAFAGLVVDDTGKLSSVERAATLPEAERRASELRKDLEGRGVHADVLVFCRAELLAQDYFHAVQEAVKSVAAKLRLRTGLREDGGARGWRASAACRRARTSSATRPGISCPWSSRRPRRCSRFPATRRARWNRGR